MLNIFDTTNKSYEKTFLDKNFFKQKVNKIQLYYVIFQNNINE